MQQVQAFSTTPGLWAAFLLVTAVNSACGGGPSSFQRPPFQPGEQHPAAQRLLTWEGEVDRTTILKFHGSRVSIADPSPSSARHYQVTIQRNIEPADFPVALVKEEGRGDVSIINQGNELNAFTVMIRIDDQYFRGWGHYRFSLFRSNLKTTTTPYFSCYLVVGGEDLIEIKGHEVHLQHVSGEASTGLKYYFTDEISQYPAKALRLRVVRGRGSVELLPSSGSNERIIIRIADTFPGEAPYEFELVPSS